MDQLIPTDTLKQPLAFRATSSCTPLWTQKLICPHSYDGVSEASVQPAKENANGKHREARKPMLAERQGRVFLEGVQEKQAKQIQAIHAWLSADCRHSSENDSGNERSPRSFLTEVSLNRMCVMKVCTSPAIYQRHNASSSI